MTKQQILELAEKLKQERKTLRALCSIRNSNCRDVCVETMQFAAQVAFDPSFDYEINTKLSAMSKSGIQSNNDFWAQHEKVRAIERQLFDAIMNSGVSSRFFLKVVRDIEAG